VRTAHADFNALRADTDEGRLLDEG
jgi:hypothetical protein